MVDLAAALSGRFNPYSMAGQSVSQIAPATAQFENPWASLAATLGTSLLGGALMGYGQKYQNDQEVEGAQKYLSALGAAGFSVPEGVGAAMTDANPETRRIGSGLAQALMSSQMATDAERSKRETDFEFDKRRMEAQSGLDFAKIREQAKLDEERQIAVDAAKIAAESGGLGGGLGGALRGVPKGMQNEALKEIGASKALADSMSYIDQQYETAKGIGKGSAWAGSVSEAFGGPPTDAKAELDRISEAAGLQFDKLLGREVNSDVRKRIVEKFGPKWYDTPEAIDAKKAGIKSALQSLLAGTPISDLAQGSSPVPVNVGGGLGADGGLVTVRQNGQTFQIPRSMLGGR